MSVVDNGCDWRMSWPRTAVSGAWANHRRSQGSDFKVVQTTGPNGGPRKKYAAKYRQTATVTDRQVVKPVQPDPAA